METCLPTQDVNILQSSRVKYCSVVSFQGKKKESVTSSVKQCIYLLPWTPMPILKIVMEIYIIEILFTCTSAGIAGSCGLNLSMQTINILFLQR